MASTFPPPPQAPVDIVPRIVNAGAGARWWADGWRIFVGSLATWVLIMIVYFVISMLLDNVPHIGAFASWLLTPVFTGGLMAGCDAVHRGQPLRVAHLFDGFKGPSFVSLLMVGVYDAVLVVLAVIIGAVVLAADIGMAGLADLSNFANDPWQLISTFGITFLLLVVLALTVAAVLAMANWFAPALIVLHDARPLAAMTTSLRACLRNWLPFLIYGLVALGIFVVFSGLFAVAMGFVGFEFFVGVYEGTLGWKSLGFGILALFAAFAATIIVAASVYYGSTWASYRDTLSPLSSAPGNPAVK